MEMQCNTEATKSAAQTKQPVQGYQSLMFTEQKSNRESIIITRI